VKDIESSVEHYGNTAATFMSNLALADEQGAAMAYMSAIAVEEKQLWDYKPQRTPTGAACGHLPVRRDACRGSPVCGASRSVGRRCEATRSRRLPRLPTSSRTPGAIPRRGVPRRRRTRWSRADEALGTLPAGPSIILPAPSPEALAEVEGSWKDVRKRAAC
jgi:Ca-activated chloride channel family protein